MINICDIESNFMPTGKIEWNIILSPTLVFFNNPTAIFIDVVLLDDYSKYYNSVKTINSLQIKKVTLSTDIASLQFDNNNSLINECLSIGNKVLAAQYLIHCERDCSFIDKQYENYTVLYSSNGKVSQKIEAMHTDIQDRSFLFKSLFITQNKLDYVSKVSQQGLKLFITKYCYKYINFQELLDHFTPSKCWSTL